jgi:hypothetical protein
MAKTLNVKSCRIYGDPHPRLAIESKEEIVYRGYGATETDNNTVYGL